VLIVQKTGRQFEMINDYYRPLKLSACFMAIMITTLVSANNEYTVRSNDNLNRIIAKFYTGSQAPRAQIQQLILAKNPAAFKGGDINFLIQGKRLILPDEGNLSRQSAMPQQGNGVEAGKSDINNARVEQSEKISQLENESEELKARLEKLVAEKTASDEKLREIEMALQKSPGQASGK
jgi:Tfp pilus assembly protein FimV